MGPTGSDENTCLFSKVWAYGAEKQSMSDVIDCEGGLDMVFGIVKTENLQPSVKNKSFDRWVALFRVVCGAGADFGQTG